MKTRYIAILLIFVMFSCGGSGDDEPDPRPAPTENKPPAVPVKDFPSDGLLCTDNPLNHMWNTSLDPDGDSVSYEVQIATNEQFSIGVQSKMPSQTNASFILDKGVAYYWRVRAKDSKNKYSDYSTVWKYYTEGEGITNHLPFAPTLISPALNETVIDVSTMLKWSSSDVDNDPLTYDVYFGNENPPVLVEENTTSTSYSVDLVTANSTYYWKIVVKDDNGGQAIGQLWTFNTQ